jgi:response regulator NasT
MGHARRSLIILVIDENKLRASVIEAGHEAGHESVTVVHDVTGIAARIAEVQPTSSLLILKIPIVTCWRICSSYRAPRKRPIAMFVDRSDTASIEAAVDAGVSAYIVDGLRKERVKPILDMAISRFNAFSRMARELEEARPELAGRKMIERAKGILMKSRGCPRKTPMLCGEKTAMNQNRKIGDIAQSLVTAVDLLGPGDVS